MKLRKLPRVHLPVLSRETSAALLVTARFAALLLLFALLSRAARSAAMPTVTIGMPGGGEIEQTATCSGTIMPQKETRILLPEDVTVTEVLVQAEQAVQAGDVLLCLSGEELQNKLDTLDAQIAQLRAQKKQLTVQPDYCRTHCFAGFARLPASYGQNPGPGADFRFRHEFPARIAPLPSRLEAAKASRLRTGSAKRPPD